MRGLRTAQDQGFLSQSCLCSDPAAGQGVVSGQNAKLASGPQLRGEIRTHQDAIRFLASVRQRLVTSDYVIDETLTLFGRGVNNSTLSRLVPT
jgi:hypothetical protein